MKHYDALLYLSFGGPVSKDEVVPFLDSVLAGKPVSPERKKEVADHYYAMGSKSPIMARNDEVLNLLRSRLTYLNTKILYANLHSKPYLKDVLGTLKDRSRILVYVTSAYSSFSGCRQYQKALSKVIDENHFTLSFQKIRSFFDHPVFLDALKQNAMDFLNKNPINERTFFLFSAHSIPNSMHLNCDYQHQLQFVSGWLAKELNLKHHRLCYQSRSGLPSIPWLEPDVLDELTKIKAQGFDNVMVYPIGFLCDHMEVVYDLDIQAKKKALALGLGFLRFPTLNGHLRYIDLIESLILEYDEQRSPLGLSSSTKPSVCELHCCSFEPMRPNV